MAVGRSFTVKESAEAARAEYYNKHFGCRGIPGEQEANVSGDGATPLAVDNGLANESTQKCTPQCEAEGQSSGGG